MGSQIMAICAKTDYIKTPEEHRDSSTTCGWRSCQMKTANRPATTKDRGFLRNVNALLCRVVKDDTTTITTIGATQTTTLSTMAVTMMMQTSFHNPSGRKPNPKLGGRHHSTRGTTTTTTTPGTTNNCHASVITAPTDQPTNIVYGPGPQKGGFHYQSRGKGSLNFLASLLCLEHKMM